jgi:cobalt/nickel transport system permease protein
MGDRSLGRGRSVRGGGDFVARTVAGVAGALERALFSEEQARLPGLLQGIDPRAKVGAALALLLAVGLARHPAVVAGVCVLAVVLAGFSRLSLLPYAKRVWLGIPLFSGLVALPSLFMLPGRPLLTLVDSPSFALAISDNGLASALMLILRVGASVSVALLLVFTTPWTELLRAVRVLRLPESFVVVLGMTYRYLFLFLHAANSLFLSRASRTVGVTSGGEQRRWAAGAAGSLMGHSLKMSGDVMMAMRARGFDGEIRTAGLPALRDEDCLLVACSVALSASLLLVDMGMR